MDASSDKSTSGSLGLGEIVGKETAISEAYSLLDSGKQLLTESSSSSVPLAVSDLSECCEILAEMFGETGEECAEAYYYYGKALLEMSRLESLVLGHALDGVDLDAEGSSQDSNVDDPESLSEDEKLAVSCQVTEAIEANFETHDKIARIHLEDGDSEEDEVSDEEASGTDVKAEDTEDEEPSDLQLAWEMLELSKVLYTKITETATGDRRKEAMAKLCDSYLGLGEVGMENENYPQAVADFKECLAMKKANIAPDSRSIAETHYQLGVAEALCGKYQDAELCLNSAISVLEARICNLGKMETSHNLANEISDLEDLVSEIKETICDHKNIGTSKVSTEISGSNEGKPLSSGGIKVDLAAAKVTSTSTVGSA